MIALVGAMFVAMGSASAQTATKPNQPTAVTANMGDDTGDNPGDLVLTWTAPTVGGEPTDYDVRYRESGTVDWMTHTSDAGDNPTVDDQATRTFGVGSADTDLLDAFETYEFQVRAKNATGIGPWSAPHLADVGQDEALGACVTTQTLELDDAFMNEAGTTDLELVDEDTAGENCTVSLEDTVIQAAANVRISKTAGATGVVTLSAVDVSGTNTGVISFTAMTAGSATYTVSIADGQGNLSQTATYTFTVVAYGAPAAADTAPAPDAALVITFPNDSDAVVPDGKNVKVMIEEKNGAVLSSVTVSGGLNLYHVTDNDTEFGAVGGFIGPRAGNVSSLWVVIPKGTAAGTYTVAASGSTRAEKGTPLSVSKTIEVGEPGDSVSAATLVLGLKDVDGKGYDTPTDSTDDTPENGLAMADKPINLELTVTNSLGNPVNSSDIAEDGIRIVAPFAEIRYRMEDGSYSGDDNTISADALSDGKVIVQVTSEGGTARTVDVYAIVIGKSSGAPRSEVVPLAFTGAASSVTVDDATSTLRSVNGDDDHSIKLVVSAVDKGGNTVVPPSVTPTITDPDGVAVGSGKIMASKPTAASGAYHITVTNVSGDSAATALKTGEYTLKLKSGSVEDTATFTVVGKADSVELMADDNAPSSVGQAITITATVTDADGEPVADGTVVTFTSRDTTADDDSVLVFTSSSGTTKGGEAQAMLVAVGPGSSVVTATADGKVAVAVITSSAGAADPVAEEASVSCLSNLSGFSTWSCGVDSSASEIFDLLIGRGKTALHLWNGSAWVRYSVVDGTMVPGSSDFMVAENDILYISN